MTAASPIRHHPSLTEAHSGLRPPLHAPPAAAALFTTAPLREQTTGMASNGQTTTADGRGAASRRPRSTDRVPPALPLIRTSSEQQQLHNASAPEPWPFMTEAPPANGQRSSASHPAPSSPFPDESSTGSGPYKRKRSDEGPEPPRPSPLRPSRAPDEPMDTARSFDRRPSRPPPSPSRDYPRALPPSATDARAYAAWYGPVAASASARARSAHDLSPSAMTSQSSLQDAQLAEVLLRENKNLDAYRAHSVGESPEEEEDEEANGSLPRSSEYGTDRTPTSAAAQAEQRRRKRVFSNRTKTGCLTCRRRKKKCDEVKPECQNCERGGFVCEGYVSKVEWQKSSREPGPAPAHARDGEGRSKHQHQHQHQPPPPPSSPLPVGVRHDSIGASPAGDRASPAYSHAPSLPPPGSSARPLPIDDHRERSERARMPSGPVPGRWSSDSHSPHPADGLARSEHAARMPSVLSLAWPGPADATMPEPVGSRAGPHPAGPAPSLGPGDPGSDSPGFRVFATAAIPGLHAKAQAQRARQQQAMLLLPAPRTEKEKMLAGQLYLPNDAELLHDREQCQAGLWRFNNAMDPNLAISRDGRAQLFRDLLQPRDGRRPSHGAAARAARAARAAARAAAAAVAAAAAADRADGADGAAEDEDEDEEEAAIEPVGAHVVVEAPFHCNYGYNITLGDDVHIGPNCTIIDACLVGIGARTVLGPNVSIVTSKVPMAAGQRKGSHGPFLARAVHIAEECWIGAGAIILSGVIVGRGSTVEPGTVVSRDIPPGVIVGGNPSRVMRLVPDLPDPSLPTAVPPSLAMLLAPSQPGPGSRAALALALAAATAAAA
ncbi:MAG: Maltose acetyltransferase, partial [Phylliscum demangeonii]